MKTLKSIVAASLIILSSAAFANEGSNAEKLSIDYALKTYIGAVSMGKTEGLAEVLDQDVKFTQIRGERIVKFSKSEMLNSLKGLDNVQQNCTTAYNVLESNSNQAVVKVSLNYDGFSKISLVTLANTGKGWKITNVANSFAK